MTTVNDYYKNAQVNCKSENLQTRLSGILQIGNVISFLLNGYDLQSDLLEAIKGTPQYQSATI